MNNASLRPPSPNTRSYFAVGRERTLPYYLEVARRIAASFLSRNQKKGGENSPRYVPRSLGPVTPQIRESSHSIVPLSAPDTKHLVFFPSRNLGSWPLSVCARLTGEGREVLCVPDFRGGTGGPVRACRSETPWEGVGEYPLPRLIPLLQRRFPGPYYSRQKIFSLRASPGEGRGRRWSGRRWIQGGRSEKSAPGKQLGAAAERGTSVTWRSRAPERGPGPARRGEGRVRRPPPRPTPSRGGREPGAGRDRSRRCLGAAGRGRRPRSAATGSAGSSSRSVRLAPGVRGALPGAGQPRADPLAPLSPVRVCFTFRLSREGAAPAGGWRARLAAGSLPARHLRPPRPALARGRREPAAGARRGRRGRARVCGAREGRRKEGRAQRPAAGAGVRPAGRGGGAPPVRS